jgi:hypothetical protein
MSELGFFRTLRSLFSEEATSLRARPARGSALIALCLVALQLVTALHFALIPHGFSAGLSGFVHVHRARSGAAAAPEFGHEQRASKTLELVSDDASCVTESCPIGFAGHHSTLVESSPATGRIALSITPERAPDAPYFVEPSRVLLSAPKTSPPA